MADSKISALTDGVSLQDADRFAVARSPFGATDNRRLTGAQLKTGVAQPSGKYLYLASSFFIGDLGLAGDTVIQVVDVGGTGFTGVCNFSGCTALVRATIAGVLFTSINLTNCSALELLRFTSTSITAIDLSDCAAIIEIDGGGSAIPTLDLTGLSTLTTVLMSGCSITSATLTGCTAIVTLNLDSNSLSTVDISDCVALLAVFLGGSALSQGAVDGVLADLDGFGLNNGEVDLSGGTNAPPSAAGLTSKANLEGKGWTVTVNV